MLVFCIRKKKKKERGAKHKFPFSLYLGAGGIWLALAWPTDRCCLSVVLVKELQGTALAKGSVSPGPCAPQQGLAQGKLLGFAQDQPCSASGTEVSAVGPEKLVEHLWTSNRLFCFGLTFIIRVVSCSKFQKVPSESDASQCLCTN